MAKAIQEAKVSPVASPNLWIRVSGTTRFGGEPVQEIKWFDIRWSCTCDHSCPTNVSSIGDTEEEKVPLRLLLAALLDVNSQLERQDQFWSLLKLHIANIITILIIPTIIVSPYFGHLDCLPLCHLFYLLLRRRCSLLEWTRISPTFESKLGLSALSCRLSIATWLCWRPIRSIVFFRWNRSLRRD